MLTLYAPERTGSVQPARQLQRGMFARGHVFYKPDFPSYGRESHLLEQLFIKFICELLTLESARELLAPALEDQSVHRPIAPNREFTVELEYKFTGPGQLPPYHLNG